MTFLVHARLEIPEKAMEPFDGAPRQAHKTIQGRNGELSESAGHADRAKCIYTLRAAALLWSFFIRTAELPAHSL